MKNQYVLYASPRSPFARRIRIALRNLNLDHRVEFINVFERNETLLKLNPLGLVPTLITPDADVIADSAAILEYFNELSNKIWPEERIAKAKARQRSTWCEGIMQNAVSYFIESAEHAVPDLSWANEYENNVIETLRMLAGLDWSFEGALNQPAIDLGIAIQYVQLRMPQIKIEKQFPSLMVVLSKCMEQKSFSETAPPAV